MLAGNICGLVVAKHGGTLRPRSSPAALLRETKKNVMEIALKVDYANLSHFEQLFRKETGLSPGNYGQQR
jgi:transcriptional regulator GlxA family with amidase domain